MISVTDRNQPPEQRSGRVRHISAAAACAIHKTLVDFIGLSPKAILLQVIDTQLVIITAQHMVVNIASGNVC